jgi:tetratricopeptide (TPR) repeat protein
MLATLSQGATFTPVSAQDANAGKLAEATDVSKHGLALALPVMLNLPCCTTIWADAGDLRILHQQVRQLHEADPRGGAVELAERVLVNIQRQYGFDDPKTALAVKYVADLYGRNDRNAEAEAHYKRAIVILEKARGPDDPDVARALLSLVALHWQNGSPLRARAQIIYTKMLDDVDWRVGALLDRGQYADALDVTRRVLAEPFHGLFRASEELYNRALAIRSKVYGPQIDSLDRQADALIHKRQYDDLEAIAKQEVTLAEQRFGPDDLETAARLTSLAREAFQRGRPVDAEPLFKRSLAIRESKLDPDDLDVGLSCTNLGETYVRLDRPAEAEPLFKRGLAISEDVFGYDDPRLTINLYDLAVAYVNQGRYAAAEPLLQRTLAILDAELTRKNNGVTSGVVQALVQALNNLAVFYEAQGRIGEATPLRERIKAIEKP